MPILLVPRFEQLITPCRLRVAVKVAYQVESRFLLAFGPSLTHNISERRWSSKRDMRGI
jgi:hypothetical protein